MTTNPIACLSQHLDQWKPQITFDLIMQDPLNAGTLIAHAISPCAHENATLIVDLVAGLPAHTSKRLLIQHQSEDQNLIVELTDHQIANAEATLCMNQSEVKVCFIWTFSPIGNIP